MLELDDKTPSQAPRTAADSGAPLDLSGARLIGRGWKRDCYQHPTDASLCIKVPSRDPKGTRRFRERLVEWCAGGSVGDQHNRREWAAYRRFGDVLAPFIPEYHGFVETSDGRGLVVELIRDADGGPSRHLKDWLQSTPPVAAAPLLDRLESLFELLLENKVWLMDLNLTNFAVQIKPDGTPWPRLVDIKRLADKKELFQVSGWSGRLMRRKLERRIERFRAKVKLVQSG